MNQQNTVCLLDDFQAKRKHKLRKTCSEGELVPAQVIPFSRQTTFLAILELDDLLAYKMLYSEIDLQFLFGKISALLQREFGRGVVRREKTCFVLGHNQFESLVAGLLRVQFYANMEDLPEFNIFGEPSTQGGITLTWGIGKEVDDAQEDLQRKRRQRNSRGTRRGRKKQS